MRKKQIQTVAVQGTKPKTKKPLDKVCAVKRENGKHTSTVHPAAKVRLPFKSAPGFSLYSDSEHEDCSTQQKNKQIKSGPNINSLQKALHNSDLVEKSENEVVTQMQVQAKSEQSTSKFMNGLNDVTPLENINIPEVVTPFNKRLVSSTPDPERLLEADMQQQQAYTSGPTSLLASILSQPPRSVSPQTVPERDLAWPPPPMSTGVKQQRQASQEKPALQPPEQLFHHALPGYELRQLSQIENEGGYSYNKFVSQHPIYKAEWLEEMEDVAHRKILPPKDPKKEGNKITLSSGKFPSVSHINSSDRKPRQKSFHPIEAQSSVHHNNELNHDSKSSAFSKPGKSVTSTVQRNSRSIKADQLKMSVEKTKPISMLQNNSKVESVERRAEKEREGPVKYSPPTVEIRNIVLIPTQPDEDTGSLEVSRIMNCSNSDEVGVKTGITNVENRSPSSDSSNLSQVIEFLKTGAFNLSSEKQSAVSLGSEQQGAFNSSSEKQGAFNLSNEKQGAFNSNREKQDAFNLSNEKQGPFNLSNEKQGPFNLSNEKQGPFNLSNEKQGAFNLSTEKQNVNNSSSEEQGIEPELEEVTIDVSKNSIRDLNNSPEVPIDVSKKYEATDKNVSLEDQNLQDIMNCYLPFREQRETNPINEENTQQGSVSRTNSEDEDKLIDNKDEGGNVNQNYNSDNEQDHPRPRRNLEYLEKMADPTLRDIACRLTFKATALRDVELRDLIDDMLYYTDAALGREVVRCHSAQMDLAKENSKLKKRLQMLNQQLDFKERQERINASNGITREDVLHLERKILFLKQEKEKLDKQVTNLLEEKARWLTTQQDLVKTISIKDHELLKLDERYLEEKKALHKSLEQATQNSQGVHYKLSVADRQVSNLEQRLKCKDLEIDDLKEKLKEANEKLLLCESRALKKDEEMMRMQDLVDTLKVGVDNVLQAYEASSSQDATSAQRRGIERLTVIAHPERYSEHLEADDHATKGLRRTVPTRETRQPVRPQKFSAPKRNGKGPAPVPKVQRGNLEPHPNRVQILRDSQTKQKGVSRLTPQALEEHNRHMSPVDHRMWRSLDEALELSPPVDPEPYYSDSEIEVQRDYQRRLSKKHTDKKSSEEPKTWTGTQRNDWRESRQRRKSENDKGTILMSTRSHGKDKNAVSLSKEADDNYYNPSTSVQQFSDFPTRALNREHELDADNESIETEYSTLRSETIPKSLCNERQHLDTTPYSTLRSESLQHSYGSEEANIPHQHSREAPRHVSRTDHEPGPSSTQHSTQKTHNGSSSKCSRKEPPQHKHHSERSLNYHVEHIPYRPHVSHEESRRSNPRFDENIPHTSSVATEDWYEEEEYYHPQRETNQHHTLHDSDLSRLEFYRVEANKSQRKMSDRASQSYPEVAEVYCPDTSKEFSRNSYFINGPSQSSPIRTSDTSLSRRATKGSDNVNTTQKDFFQGTEFSNSLSSISDNDMAHASCNNINNHFTSMEDDPFTTGIASLDEKIASLQKKIDRTKAIFS
ncbi:uncharacterized protein LOC131930616 [Physella acuta]|uniref:uncharacterized protein LOC131930616 n=1 Tax=Physella acuta TaxID=109671 RepID=UPI0027DB5664|nr:uncharacterized protein LOC131930616 [Physella acuta]